MKKMDDSLEDIENELLTDDGIEVSVGVSSRWMQDFCHRLSDRLSKIEGHIGTLYARVENRVVMETIQSDELKLLAAEWEQVPVGTRHAIADLLLQWSKEKHYGNRKGWVVLFKFLKTVDKNIVG